MDKGKCVKTPTENCDISTNVGNCDRCLHGFFLDKTNNKCIKCHSTCLECDGSGEADCTSCPVDRFSQIVDDKSFSKKGSLHRMVMFNKRKCVEKCEPINGFSSKPNPFTQVCEKTDQKYSVTKGYEFFHSYFLFNTGNFMMMDVNRFKGKVQQYVSEDLKEAKELQKSEKTDYSPECGFRGHVKERLSAEKETFFECRCRSDTYGARCEFNKGLYNAVNKFIGEIIIQVSLFLNKFLF